MNSTERLQRAADDGEVVLDVYLTGYRITKWWNMGKPFGLEARHMGVYIPWHGEASYFKGEGVLCTLIEKEASFHGPYLFIERIHVGRLCLTKAEHTRILRELAHGRYRPESYDIAYNNCLDFCSDMLLRLGLKADIPQEYLDPVPWARWWSSMGTEFTNHCSAIKSTILLKPMQKEEQRMTQIMAWRMIQMKLKPTEHPMNPVTSDERSSIDRAIVFVHATNTNGNAKNR
jgi:hypothetical protein